MKKTTLTAYERWELPHIESIEKNILKKDKESVRISEEEIACIKAAAYKEGYQSGYNEGFATGQQDINEHIQALKGILDYQTKPLAELEDTLEHSIIELLISMVKQVVRTELALNQEQFLVLFKEAVALLPANKRTLRVHLHPDDSQLLSEHYKSDALARFELCADTSITRGGCHLEAGYSSVDVTVESRLQQVIDQLLGKT